MIHRSYFVFMFFSIMSLNLTQIKAASKATSPVILGVAESNLQLAQISALLIGEYDNEPQRYYLTGMKRGPSAPPRLHVNISLLKEGSSNFALEEREGNEHIAPTRTGTLTLSAETTTRQILMRLTSTQTTVSTTASSAITCVWRWERRPNVWVARPQDTCSNTSDNSKLSGLAGATLWLSSDELWLETAGQTVLSELGRARSYDCYVALKPRGAKVQMFMSLKIHDRGGTVELITDETPARKLNLMLRRGTWPSNSGNNLVELLILYLHEEGTNDKLQPSLLGTGWATPESSRVGFGIEEEGIPEPKTANARCKKIN